jgi:hypothetical protein
MVPEAIPVSDWSYTNFFSIKLLGELDLNFVRMVYGNRSAFSEIRIGNKLSCIVLPTQDKIGMLFILSYKSFWTDSIRGEYDFVIHYSVT